MDETRSETNFRIPVVFHPGETVSEFLEVLGWTQKELSRRTGLTPKTISEICNGKGPITPQTSLLFEKVLGRPAHFWLNLQRAYDESLARSEAVARAQEWQEWASVFPTKDLRRLGFLRETGNVVDELLRFLGVSSPDAWRNVWGSTAVAYRQTRRFEVSSESMSAWLRATELVAQQMNVPQFAPNVLEASIPRLRGLTRRRVSDAIEEARQLCAEAGVAVVLLPEFPHTGISGCARWVGERSVIVALSLRYKTDDQMWFTFFHELGHALLHLGQRKIIMDNPAGDLADSLADPEMQALEDEANRFAANTLVPADAWADFISQGEFTNESIPSFADKVGIGPGIVVGRLQREGFLKHFQGNAFKQKLSFSGGDA